MAAGRLIDVPYAVCIRVKRFLDEQVANNVQGVIAAFKDDAIVADVFVRFVACDRGKTPSFATLDDYDATDAFAPNRLLDSSAMLLVLRGDQNPRLPQDPPADGLKPIAQLQRIARRTEQLVAQQYGVWNESILPALADAGIRIHTMKDLDAKGVKSLDKFFRQEIFPVLTPMAIDPSHLSLQPASFPWLAMRVTSSRAS